MSLANQPEPRDLARVRRSRNRVLALLLAGFVVLVYFISIAKMG
ncbi:MAG: hypothetical protein ABIT04_05730 [Novosphingobium sp.]